MNTNDHNSRKSFIISIAIATIVICIIVLFFFRNEIFSGALSAIVSILTPFLYGGAIAYILHPLSRLFEKFLARLFKKKDQKKRSGILRMISILLSLAILVGGIILLLLIVLPELVESIARIVEQIPDVLKSFDSWLEEMDQGGLSHEIITPIRQVVDTLTTNFESFLKTTVLPNMKTLLNSVTSSVMSLLNLIKNFGLGCIIAAYFLGGWEKFIAQAKIIVFGIFPEKAACWIREEAHYVDKMFSGFIVGKLVDSLIVGLLCFVFMFITKMPYAVLISVIVGVTNMIPFFGPYLGAIPSALILLTISPWTAVFFVIFIVILQQFDGNILGPRILGDKLGLSAFWILFAIILFGAVWGVVGMIVGAPLFAVLYDLIRRLITYSLRRKGRDDILNAYQEEYCEPKKETKKRHISKRSSEGK